MTWNWPNVQDGFTSKYTYTADLLGSWKAELQSWSLLGGWTVIDTAYADVINTPTPTPTPSPTPSPTSTPSPTPTPLPTQPPSNVKGVLIGSIKSTTGEQLDDVFVTVDTGETMQSNNGGNYAGIASEGWHYVTASLSGYITQTEHIYINPIEDLEGPLEPLTPLDFTLEPEFQLLPDLTISWNDISFEKVI